MHYLKLLLVTVVVSSSFLFAGAQSTSAHGDATLTLTATTTQGYVSDVDYSDLFFEAARPGRFGINLFTDATRAKSVDFTDVWAQVVVDSGKNKGSTIFAGPITKQEFGGTGFLYTFSDEGSYLIKLRYNDSSNEFMGRTVAEAQLPITVLRSADANSFHFSKEFWIGLVSGIFGLLILLLPLLMKRKSK